MATTTGDTINGPFKTLDFTKLVFAPGATAAFNSTTGVLTVTSGDYYESLTLNNSGLSSFTAQSDGNGGTSVAGVGTSTVAIENQPTMLCFVSGTLIATPGGRVPVDMLRVGDPVLTQVGESRVVRWLGCRELRKSDKVGAMQIDPVRIRAGAFGDNLPERDLFLSPGHPVLVGDHLVPIMCLINGTSISRHPVASVTYWHVELEQHDILLAEGLPCESYIDLGSRPWFDGSDAPLHDPEFMASDMPGRSRPVAIDGPIVEAERQRLDAVFAAGLVAPCAWPSRDEATLTV